MPIKIFIDQGHNSESVNVGAQGFGLNEGEITYKIGTRLAALLAANPEFEVRTSRTCPEQVLGYNTESSLAQRVCMANSWPADYFISLHCNASVNPEVNGTEMYVFRNGIEAQFFAEALQKAIVNELGTKNNGVFANPSLYVLRKTAMPAVLAELAYITNCRDAALLEKDGDRFAKAMYNGILTYFGLS